jgi:glycosyltransferase involved in cell wall biosynthesis
LNERRIVALMGRRDEPTDAVEEYCRYLGGALRKRGFAMELARVPWLESGWPIALRELRERSRDWRNSWVLLQYTALAWSARGFPMRLPRLVKQLRDAGARIAVVYHDVEPYGGARVIDRVRQAAQLRVMRQVLTSADLIVFTVPLGAISWLGRAACNAVFIPVGANLPTADLRTAGLAAQPVGPLRIAVFGITEGATGRKECDRIVDALRFATTNGRQFRLHAFGRGASEFESQLRAGLRDVVVKVCVNGVLPPEQVVKALLSSDVALFVRGPISSRRGSAIAGIACGLPVIAYAGPETASPITDAGVLLVPKGKKVELGKALVLIADDAKLRASLAERSRQVYQEHFAWDAIAERYINALNEQSPEKCR